MASLRRKFYSRPVPAGAVRTTHKGKPAVRFPGRDGKPVVAVLATDGENCRVPADKWYGRFVDADGRVREVPLSPNKAAAQQMLAGLVKRVELEKAGVKDPFADHNRRPLADHLADWEQVLTVRGNTPDYVRMKVCRTRKLIDACGFVHIADLSASAVEAALADMRIDPRFGTQTSNHYLA